MASDFTLGTDGTAAINTILAEEANRIGNDIHKRVLHTSPWINLVKQTTFPDGLGYQLATLVYDRAIPTVSDGGAAGTNWAAVGTQQGSANAFNTVTEGGDSLKDTLTETAGVGGSNRSFLTITKELKEYSLSRAIIESPRISLEDLRFATHRQDQLRAVMDTMTEATRFTWEQRYRDEFERLAANLVLCETTGTTIKSSTIDSGDGSTTADENFEGLMLAHGTAASAVNIENTTNASETTNVSESLANISNAIMDKVYYSLVRKGGGSNAYGRENGRPVFGLVLSSEASYQLQTEAGFRDDVRYNNAKVSDLIAPLGVEKSFRGFYHLVDDMAPRFTVADTGLATAVSPYSISSAGVVTMNGSYDTADYEAAYIIHPEVMESQIPAPLSGAGAIKFDPVSYKGEWKWKNILHEHANPDGTLGFFRGVLASASKPIKTDLGYVILFKRTSSTPAA
tara:strand:- start:1475 stop:2839 length:1365 start_codon:yes stop_codon:yes gene_type:complete